MSTPGPDAATDNLDDKRKWTNLGWPSQYGPWQYTPLTPAEITAQLPLYAYAEHDLTTCVSSVTYQPCLNEEHRSQDRRVVQAWDMSGNGGGGMWSFVGVFDGHAGHETVDHAVVEIPLRVRAALEAFLNTTTEGTFSTDYVSAILVDTIEAYDQSLLADLCAIFPEPFGVDAVDRLSESEIDAIINDGGENLRRVHRCMRGATALVTLVDPARENVWVANLGDCQAVLGTKSVDGTWSATRVSANHNGADDAEAKRIKAEHLGEDECILQGRVLGALAVTRALGDYVFKFPQKITEKIFLRARPGFQFRSGRSLDEWLPRNLTPPYVSRIPEVYHRHLQKGGGGPDSKLDGPGGDAARDVFLIMCSDGLPDLKREAEPHMTNDLGRWATVVGGALEEGGNAAVALLREALGGDDVDAVSQYMTLEYTESWMDDVTVAVVEF